MSNADITKEEIMAIYPKVAEIIADALGRDEEDVKPDSSLINDLDAESIDFLQIVFNLEREFKVKIPRGKAMEEARGELSEEEFQQGGIVTDAGVAKIRAYLTEVSADRIKTPLKAAEIPKLFTSETFCKMVIREQKGA